MAVTINGTTGIVGVDGSASTPAVQGTDTNTGIFFPAADTIAFAEGGTEVMRIDSSGNMGIGGTSAGEKLEVVGGIETSGGASSFNRSGLILDYQTGSSLGRIAVGPSAGGTLAFYTGNGATVPERMRIDSSGNVGIGTSSPTGGKLHIAHGNEFGIYTSGSYNFQAKFESTDPEAAIVIEDSDSTNDGNRIGVIGDNMAFTTANTERMRIASTGELLVNTTTVQTGAKLAVTGGIQGTITSGTAVVNPTSPASASIDFTGIPSWVKRITVIFSGLSLTSTADILVQLGDSGGFETTGYISSGSATGTGSAISTSTAGMIIRSAAAASITSGIMTIQNLTGNSWVASYSGKQSSTSSSYGGGDKTLSDTLTQIRITTTSTDTFDAGTVNIFYEG